MTAFLNLTALCVGAGILPRHFESFWFLIWSLEIIELLWGDLLGDNEVLIPDDNFGASALEPITFRGVNSGASFFWACPVDATAKLASNDNSSLFLFFIMG